MNTISDTPAVQKRYEALIRKGESHAIAEMLAVRKAPGCVTDDTFFAGTKNGQQFSGNVMQEFQGDLLASKLRKAGGSPAGKKYLGQLARFTGDPEAWVSTRGEVKAILEKNNWGAQGQVKRSIVDSCVEPEPPKDVADRIVRDEMLTIAEDTPELVRTPQQREDVLHQIKEKRTPHWKKKK
jgi:hypothetical protein